MLCHYAPITPMMLVTTRIAEKMQTTAEPPRSKAAALLRQSFCFAPDVAPTDFQIADCSRRVLFYQHVEHLEQHAALEFPVKRYAEVMPHGPGNEDGPRYFEKLGHVSRNGDGHRRNPSLFDCTLNQSDRLMADRSGRDE